MGVGRGAGPPRPGGGMPVLGPGGPRSGREGGCEQRPPGAGPSPLVPLPPAGAHLGHLAGLWRLGVLEGGHLLAGELQVPLARGLEPAVAHAAVVKAPALPVLPLQFPVPADPEPLRRAPAGAEGTGRASPRRRKQGRLRVCAVGVTGHVCVQRGWGGRLTPPLSVQRLDGQRRGHKGQGLRAELGRPRGAAVWHRLTPRPLTPCSLLARSSCQAQSRPGFSFSGLEHGLPVHDPRKGLGAPECRSPSSGGGGVCWVGGRVGRARMLTCGCSGTGRPGGGSQGASPGCPPAIALAAPGG